MSKRPQDITSAERMERVDAVFRLLLSAKKRFEIIQFCRESFNVGEEAVDRYIADARERIRESMVENDIKDIKSTIIARLEDLYSQNYDIENFAECRNVLKQTAEILGVFAPTKIDHTTDGEKLPASNPTILVEIVKPKEE
jgi:hypothetical protein